MVDIKIYIYAQLPSNTDTVHVSWNVQIVMYNLYTRLVKLTNKNKKLKNS